MFVIVCYNPDTGHREVVSDNHVDVCNSPYYDSTPKLRELRVRYRTQYRNAVVRDFSSEDSSDSNVYYAADS